MASVEISSGPAVQSCDIRGHLIQGQQTNYIPDPENLLKERVRASEMVTLCLTSQPASQPWSPHGGRVPQHVLTSICMSWHALMCACVCTHTIKLYKLAI